MSGLIWNLEYRKVSNYQPRSELAKGDLPPEFTYWGTVPILPLEDTSADGGINLQRTTTSSGRRVRPEGVPTKIVWLSKRTPTDFQWTTVYSVSERLRCLIEALEPGIHQFEPLAIVTKSGKVMENRWFWQVCNRIDTINPERTTLTRKPGSAFYRATEKGQKFVHNPGAVGMAKIWCEKHMSSPNCFCTQEVKVAFEKAAITGTEFTPVEIASG